MDDYFFIERRGEGSFAEVWEVESKLTGKRAAIKILKKKYETIDHVQSDAEFRILTYFSKNHLTFHMTAGDKNAVKCANETHSTNAVNLIHESEILENALTTTGPSSTVHSPNSCNSTEPSSVALNNSDIKLLESKKGSRHPGGSPVRFHPQLTGIYDAFYDASKGQIVYVLELLGRSLLDEIIHRRKLNYGAIRFNVYDTPKQLFTLDELRVVLYQILKGVLALHKKGIFHRDIKPENILMMPGTELRLKVSDFGSSKIMPHKRIADHHHHSSSALCSNPKVCKKAPFTEYIATRWYRSPECLLTSGRYGAAMDLWAVGCVAAELVSGQPLFPGEDETDQLRLIHGLFGNRHTNKFSDIPSRDEVREKLGNVNEHVNFPDEDDSKVRKIPTTRCIPLHRTTNTSPSSGWFSNKRLVLSHPSREKWNQTILPRIGNLTEDFNDLLYHLLAYYPQERITAADAVHHRFFAPCRKDKSFKRNRQNS